MDGKTVNLEWLDMLLAPATYKVAQGIIDEKNRRLPTNEGYWRLPSPYEIWVIRNVFSRGVGFRNPRYMCRSSRADGRFTVVDLDGKKSLVSPETCSHFFVVRCLRIE